MSVSRVLNEHPNVSPVMRRRVLKAVDKLGYRRNENARSIRPGQRSGLVGVVVTNIENPYYAQVVLGIEDVLDSLGRRILVGTSHNEPEREKRLVRDFAGRQVEGLVLVPTGGDMAELRSELGERPVVLASREHPELALDTVVIDDFAGASKGVADLLLSRHRRVGFLGNDPSVSTSQRRYEGYVAGHATAGVPVDPDLVVLDCGDVESSRRAAAHVLALDEPPTALFCANNQVTIGALLEVVPAAREGGAPVELLGVDDFSLSELIQHPLTIIDHDARELGRAAARMLWQRLEGNSPAGPMRLLMPTELRRLR